MRRFEWIAATLVISLLAATGASAQECGAPARCEGVEAKVGTEKRSLNWGLPGDRSVDDSLRPARTLSPGDGKSAREASVHLVQGPAPEFGTPNVVFVVGIWRIVRTKDDFYFWRDNGELAIQVTRDSNGWWGLRRQSREDVVRSSGALMDTEGRDNNFYDRPWSRASGATRPVSTLAYEFTGTQGTTFIRVANDQIRITLTDKGEIVLNSRQRNIIFRTREGASFTY